MNAIGPSEQANEPRYQVRDRLSARTVPRAGGLGDRVPDAKTVWLYREGLARAGMVDALFAQSGGYLARQGYIARGGQILDVERAGATGSVVWADAAWRSAEIEAALKARKLTSHSHRKGQRGKPLTGQAQNSNRTKSTLRVRVEPLFGARAVEPGGTLVRTIGVASGCSNRWRDRWRLRAKARIGTPNLADTMRRLGQLGHLNPCPA